MSDSTAHRNDGLWGRETGLPTLTSQNGDRRPPAAATVTAQQRAQQLALQQQLRASAAARLDDEHAEDRRVDREVDDRDHEPDLSVDPWLSDDELLTRLDGLPGAHWRVIDLVDGDNRLVSVIDLDGDGHIDAYEMSAALITDRVTDWGDVADGIDERIAESPSWPALNTALMAADAHDGYNVAATLLEIAAEAPLPTYDPAGELYYRLLNSGAVDVDGNSAAGADAQPPPRRDESPTYGADAPRVSAPAV